jgi:dTDP-4-amino-4,6-dideoxygalactose transaminase
MPARRIPFIRPNPPKLSELKAELAGIEASGIFSNYGPVNTRFEDEVRDTMFGGVGACVTACNATIALMMAIRHALAAHWGDRRPEHRRFALMPSFTFAATAHAALWCGLTPLFCDIDEATWTPSAAAEDALIRQYGSEIAVVVPYATFGNDLDLERYDRLSGRHGIPVVIDAAASLGTLNARGEAFGAGYSHPVIFSLHTTKPFATLEGGLIYCADHDTIAALRAIGNFGFAEPRVASMPGLNAKLNEITALMGLVKLRELEQVTARRESIAAAYRAELHGWTFQRLTGQRHAFTFMPVLLPDQCSEFRRQILAHLAAEGIGAGTYFSPHLAEHPYFQRVGVAGDLTATERIAHRIVTLPMSDFMTPKEIRFVAEALRQACDQAATAQLAPLETASR